MPDAGADHLARVDVQQPGSIQVSSNTAVAVPVTATAENVLPGLAKALRELLRRRRALGMWAGLRASRWVFVD